MLKDSGCGCISRFSNCRATVTTIELVEFITLIQLKKPDVILFNRE